MKLSTYKCDGCGVLRSNDANNWWLGKLVGCTVVLSPFGAKEVWPEAAKGVTMHLCGVQCALKWATGHMSNPLTPITNRLNEGGQTK